MNREMDRKPGLEFYGGYAVSFIPLVIFVITAVLCFVVFHVFDMEALAAGAFAGLVVTALLAKNWGDFWGAAQRGLGNPVSSTLVLIFFIVSIFSKMMAKSGVAQGFVWLGDSIGMSGGMFTAFTFIATCIITTAIGSSIGTVFSCFPIFYPSGLLLGCDPAMLAGAIISGAVFGDNLAPVSDTTIVSSTTQTFTKKTGSADIAGVVSSRLRYSIAASIMACVGFVLLGGGGSLSQGGEEILRANMDVKGLAMIIPVVFLLAVAMKTRDVFKSIVAGIFSGTIVALLFGLITPMDIVYVQDGVMSGFVFEGIKGVMSTVTFTMSLFAVIGVMNEAGAMDVIVSRVLGSNLARTPRGAEISIAVLTVISTIVLGGNAGASVVMCGPVVDQIGKTQNLHPYRRANLLDGFANSLPIVIPFLSAFVFIGAMIIDGMTETYEFIEAISPMSIAMSVIYPMCLFCVLCFSVAVGWGRRFEGPDGVPVKADK